MFFYQHMTRTIKRKKSRSQDEAVYDITNLLKTKFALVLMPTWSLHVCILRYSVSSKVDIVTNLVGSTKRVRNILFKSNKLLTKKYSNEILKIIRTKFLFQQNKINIFWRDERIINKFELELIWCEENGKKWTHIIDTMYFFFFFEEMYLRVILPLPQHTSVYFSFLILCPFLCFWDFSLVSKVVFALYCR